MTATLKKKADQLIAELNPEERVELADLLYATLPRQYEEQVDKAWAAEIGRRLDEYEAGRARILTSEESFAGARKALREARRASVRRKP